MRKADLSYSEMGNRIKKRRKELGMTQMFLAEYVGISNNHMSSIETGRENPSLETFLKICACLKTTPDYLLLGSIHIDDIPASILEMLRLCDKSDLPTIQDIVRIFVNRASSSTKSKQRKRF